MYTPPGNQLEKVQQEIEKELREYGDSLREDISDANIARIYEICYGNYEEKSSLEDKYMHDEMRLK
jgi:hypothetical protein